MQKVQKDTRQRDITRQAGGTRRLECYSKTELHNRPVWERRAGIYMEGLISIFGNSCTAGCSSKVMMRGEEMLMQLQGHRG